MCARDVDRLLAEVAADPWGQIAASPYETGRLVAIAPWLAGHEARLAYLCQAQQADGTWGGPDGYALVPTLSATAALLAQPPDGSANRAAVPADRLDRAAQAGLRALRRWLDPHTRRPVPDTTASELVVPALVADVNRLTAGTGPPSRPPPGPPLRLPDGFERRTLDRGRAALATGRVPPGVAYTLELFGPAAVASPLVRPAMGSVGLSPAATAAWLGGPGGHRGAHEFLDRLQARGGGPVPVVSPITYFEAAWVLNTLALAGAGRASTAGRAQAAVSVILDRLAAGLSREGAPVAPGVPPDADDTAVVLAALLRHRRTPSPESLLGFYAGGYFRCFHGERDPSVSTNAHALEAIALYTAGHPATRGWYGPAASATTEWLLAAQDPDGSWWDKWHASPYYATACCVVALAEHGGPGTPEAIDRAVAWVRDTVRPDGSWGRWGGTVEETAYAVQILALAPPEAPVLPLLAHAAAFLDRPTPADHQPLWHGKDLYTPVLVVKAAHLCARILAGRHASPARSATSARSAGGEVAEDRDRVPRQRAAHRRSVRR